MSVIEIAKQLIKCPSVTPADAGAQDYLGKYLQSLGFEIFHLPFYDVPNLFARIGSGAPHICYAGHTDVVPPGPAGQWTYGPFNPTVADGKLYGRGASDMKGSVAAFAAAAAAYIRQNGAPTGSISMLITGDEEGPATHGTVKILEWMAQHGHTPDVCLVGEPTNPDHLGQEIKIGRRGSLTGTITVHGKQGHVAYPHLADNPVPRIVRLLDALASYKFDKGTKFFPPTNLEITTIDVGNTASNVIPQSAKAQFNVRFNDKWTRETIEQKIRAVLDKVKEPYTADFRIDGSHSFLTKPGAWSALVRDAVKDITGKTPEYTTNGGTSDARFIAQYCPVVEFGPVNATIHQINENADVQVLEDLTRIYARVLELYFKS
ncbi:MAG: succinyl-diaminopimelate desuccinylase [Alphaproteobacteria bacterium PRO2]|nr:succinyl-diaminopimelate desuccinylase [Alphaproteobacteria bacterium PRO2]